MGTISNNTITRAEGSWIQDGLKLGDRISVYTDSDSTGGASLRWELQGEYELVDIQEKEITLAGQGLADSGGPVPIYVVACHLEHRLDTVTRSAGSWIADGFRRGQGITDAKAGGNNGEYEILRIDPTGTTLFLAPDSLSNAGPASGITVRSDRPQGYDARMGFLPYRVFDVMDVDLTIGLVLVISGVANIYTAATNPEEYRGFADTALIHIYRDLIDSVSTSLMPIMLAAVAVYEAVRGALLFARGVLVKIGLLMGIVFALAISMLGTEELAALALVPIFAAMFLGDHDSSLLRSLRPKSCVISAN